MNTYLLHSRWPMHLIRQSLKRFLQIHRRSQSNGILWQMPTTTLSLCRVKISVLIQLVLPPMEQRYIQDYNNFPNLSNCMNRLQPSKAMSTTLLRSQYFIRVRPLEIQLKTSSSRSRTWIVLITKITSFCFSSVWGSYDGVVLSDLRHDMAEAFTLDTLPAVTHLPGLSTGTDFARQWLASGEGCLVVWPVTTEYWPTVTVMNSTT